MPIDLSRMSAIDMHVHADMSCPDRKDPAMAQVDESLSMIMKDNAIHVPGLG